MNLDLGSTNLLQLIQENPKMFLRILLFERLEHWNRKNVSDNTRDSADQFFKTNEMLFLSFQIQ